MFKMKKYLLLPVVIISFVLLSPPVIQAEENPQIILRSSHRDLIVYQIQIISNIFIVNKHNYGFYGHSTIINSYENKSENGDNVVIDHATGLIWQQSGSDEVLDLPKAEQWVIDLNDKGFAGYSDWSLPTAEEAISLLEPGRNTSNLYIDPVFDTKQTGIWTGDKNTRDSYLKGAGCVRFDGGYGGGNACWVYNNATNYVRLVRSVNTIQ